MERKGELLYLFCEDQSAEKLAINTPFIPASPYENIEDSLKSMFLFNFITLKYFITL